MTRLLTPEEVRLDQLWREHFGQPLPMIGAPEVARRILRQHGVAVRRPSDAKAAALEEGRR
ncbi:hypothetical protein O3U67_04925 [Brevundimonas diminuta]|jgi:hypothetical protein|uniref:Uncharacterized protein n=1 Tax=Brevundimonas diminuta TaxID=293 RepID=A0A1Z3LTV4_BREDI|nr:hypothetical protein [Brevundimonas diminuta]ASD25648.1 hypothetical protein CD943_01320 [Brevundimonas diminuta]MCZ4107414.1 hypothetical protein [Brevundimonas diminuta]